MMIRVGQSQASPLGRRLAAPLAFSRLGSGGDHSERIVPSRMGFMCFAEETCHPSCSCKLLNWRNEHDGCRAQSPGQGEAPFGSSPLTILLVSGERMLYCTLPSLQVTHVWLLCTIIHLKCLPPRKSIYFNHLIAEQAEHSSRALLTQPAVTGGV